MNKFSVIDNHVVSKVVKLRDHATYTLQPVPVWDDWLTADKTYNLYLWKHDYKIMAMIENGLADTAMYDSTLLAKLDWESRKANFKNGISPTNPGEGLVMRPMNSGDVERGYLKLLSQLTLVGDVSKELFLKRFSCMCASGDYFITVIEDTNLNEIIGTASLILEQKFIHHASTRGRIEDVVVNSDYRGKQLGKLLVETQTLLGKHLGTYKMSLECSSDKKPFYEGFGYISDGNNFMVQRFKD